MFIVSRGTEIMIESNFCLGGYVPCIVMTDSMRQQNVTNSRSIKLVLFNWIVQKT